MIDSKHLIGLVNLHFKQKQLSALERQYTNEQILLKNEEYTKVYYDLKKVLVALERARFNEENEKINALEEQKTILEKQKALIKSKIQLPRINVDVDCKTCNDNGFLENGDYCHCFYEKLTDEAYDFLKTKRHKLPTFVDDKLSNIIDLTRVYSFFYNYADNFTTDKPSILFLGQCGTGKTFLASLIASKIAEKNFNVLFFTAIEFNQILLNFHLAPSSEKKIYSDILSTCDMLVIDDLGTEPIYKNVTIEYLLSILSERISLNKPTLITSNLQPDNLAVRYTERVFSRIAGNKTIKQNFQGKDLRLTKF